MKALPAKRAPAAGSDQREQSSCIQDGRSHRGNNSQTRTHRSDGSPKNTKRLLFPQRTARAYSGSASSIEYGDFPLRRTARNHHRSGRSLWPLPTARGTRSHRPRSRNRQPGRYGWKSLPLQKSRTGCGSAHCHNRGTPPASPLRASATSQTVSRTVRRGTRKWAWRHCSVEAAQPLASLPAKKNNPCCRLNGNRGFPLTAEEQGCGDGRLRYKNTAEAEPPWRGQMATVPTVRADPPSRHCCSTRSTPAQPSPAWRHRQLPASSGH